MRKVIILVLLCTITMLAYGDNDKKGRHLFKANNNVELIDSLRTAVDSLTTVLLVKDSLLHIAEAEPDTIVIFGNDSVMVKIQADSICALSAMISSRDSIIVEMQNDLGFADTCMVTLAYRRCYEKYNKKNVEKAISFFDRLHTIQLKKDRERDLLPLLQQYETLYSEVITILTTAQNDPDRLDNPFVEKEYRERYISLLKKSRYYSRYYNADWKIMYLNNLIDESIEILNKHTAATAADFKKYL